MRKYLVLGLLIIVVAGGLLYRKHAQQEKVAQWSSRCYRLSQAGRWETVESIARKWITSGQETSAAYFWLGEALKFQEKFDEAVAAYENVPLQANRGMDASVERMNVKFHALNQVSQALDIGEDLLNIDPKRAGPRRQKIYYCAMTLQRGKLIEEIQTAIQHGVDIPEHYVYLMTIDDLHYDDGPEIVEKWRQQDLQNSELENAFLAQSAMKKRAAYLTDPSTDTEKTYSAWKSRVEEALQDSPQDPALLGTLLIDAQEQGDIERTEILLKQVSGDSANDPLFWRIRGWYFTQTKNYANAEQAYLQALKIHPLSWQTMNEYGILLREMQKTEQAGKFQELAASGTKIVNEIRSRGHTRNLDFEFLYSIVKFANECGAQEIASGMLKRLPPKS